MTDSVVVEGYVRFRDGKKWKTRWVALRKPSPVADCLVLLVFRDKSEKAQGQRERASLTLEDICGLEAGGPGPEGVPHTLAVLCLTQAAVLGFDSRDTLLAWEIRIQYSLGEVHRFSVCVAPGTKLEGGPAALHICNNLLALARGSPPVVIGHWNLPDLRRYGPVPTGFVFEGGTRCGYWAGVFFLATPEGDHVSFLLDCIVRGVSPNRSPFGLRPVLPDPSGSVVPVQSEEQVYQEDQDLERRLSLLSHRFSTASSTFAPGPAAAAAATSAGDDRSLSGSSDASDASRSEGSAGSRLAVWAEPSPPPSLALALGPGPGASDAAACPLGFARLTVPSAERLSVAAPGGGARALAKPPRPLQEIGRQRSSDSGIATTGSHSSYSGSFSSYTSSLDGVPGEEYAAAEPPGPCTCKASSERGHAHPAPATLGHLYDTPRSVARDDDLPRPATAPQATPTTLPVALLPPPHRLADSETVGGVTGLSLSLTSPHPGLVQSGESRSAPGDIGQSHAPKMASTICPRCGGHKGPLYSPASCPGITATPDARATGEREPAPPAHHPTEQSGEAEEKAKNEVLGGSGPSRFLQEAEGAIFVFPPEGPAPERPWPGDGVTYVNIPISPTSKKQLHYMELEIKEAGSFRGPAHLPAQKTKGVSTKYALIDITATETAHKVGTQHALGRQEGLHTLEMRRRGAPQ